MFVNKSGRNEHSVYRTFHWCFLPSFGSFDQAVSEENNFQKSTSQKPELHVAAMFVNGSELNGNFLQRTSHRCFLLSFDSFGQANSEEKNFQKSTNQKQEWPVADMFENGSEQNDLPIYRGPSIDASYQFQVYLVMRFQRKIILRNQPIRNKNCLWRPCLLTNRDEMSNFYRGLLIDDSYKFLFIWSSGFRGEDFFYSANQKQELAVVPMFINGAGRNQQSLQRTFHRCFLPSLSSFGKVS